MSLKAIIALVFLALAIEQIQAGVQWTGVNLAGAEFGKHIHIYMDDYNEIYK
jgi:hypothetical protein